MDPLEEPQDNSTPDAADNILAEMQMQKAQKNEQQALKKSFLLLKGISIAGISFGIMLMVRLAGYLPLGDWNCKFWASLLWIGVGLGIVIAIFSRFRK